MSAGAGSCGEVSESVNGKPANADDGALNVAVGGSFVTFTVAVATADRPPGSVVRTEWKTSDIWLRREFTLTAAKFNEVRLTMHHDEDAEVYLNGVLAAKTQRWIGDYEDFDLSAESVRSLQAGRNVLAVHCHQTSGGQYIDAGLVNYEAPPP